MSTSRNIHSNLRNSTESSHSSGKKSEIGIENPYELEISEPVFTSRELFRQFNLQITNKIVEHNSKNSVLTSHRKNIDNAQILKNIIDNQRAMNSKRNTIQLSPLEQRIVKIKGLDKKELPKTDKEMQRHAYKLYRKNKQAHELNYLQDKHYKVLDLANVSYTNKTYERYKMMPHL